MKKREILKLNKKLSIEMLVKIFYAFDLTLEDLDTIKDGLQKSIKLPVENLKQVDEVLSFYKNNGDRIDELIASHLIDWRFDRLGKVEKAVLRVGVSYIIHLKNLYSQDRYEKEIRYIISSLLEILECYGGNKDSVRFVNGVLGRIFREQSQQPEAILSA